MEGESPWATGSDGANLDPSTCEGCDGGEDLLQHRPDLGLAGRGRCPPGTADVRASLPGEADRPRVGMRAVGEFGAPGRTP